MATQAVSSGASFTEILRILSDLDILSGRAIPLDVLFMILDQLPLYLSLLAKHAIFSKIVISKKPMDDRSHSYLDGVAVHDCTKVNADGLEEGDNNFEGAVPEGRRERCLPWTTDNPTECPPRGVPNNSRN
jgi:hypothetical protein